MPSHKGIVALPIAKTEKKTDSCFDPKNLKEDWRKIRVATCSAHLCFNPKHCQAMTETQETSSARHHENLLLRLTVTLMDEWNLNNTTLASTWSMAMAIQKKALWNLESWKRKTAVKTKTQSNRSKLKNLMQCCWNLKLFSYLVENDLKSGKTHESRFHQHKIIVGT